ncbi:MAG: MFS transporter [Coriobacteriales bacterium]
MTAEVKKKDKDISSSALLKVVLVFTSIAMVNDMIIYPVAEPMFGEYWGQASDFVLNGIISGSGLTCIVGSVLAGVLAFKFGKKTLVAWSYAIWVCSTIPNAFIGDPNAIFAMRLISGLGMGAISTLGAALIADFFQDEKQNSRMMGWYMAMMGLVGVIVSYASGIIAISNWHMVFWLYLIGVPVLIGIIVVVPNKKPEQFQEEAAEEGAGASETSTPWGKIIAAVLACFVVNLLFSSYFTMNGMYVADSGLGDTSIAGGITSLISLGSMVLNFFFGFLFMKMKRAMPILFACLFAFAHIIVGTVLQVPVVYVMSAILGICYGMSYTYYLTYVAIITPPKHNALALGLVNGVVSFAFFLGPYVSPAINAITNTTTYAQSYVVIGILFVVFAILSIILTVVHVKKNGSVDIVPTTDAAAEN